MSQGTDDADVLGASGGHPLTVDVVLADLGEGARLSKAEICFMKDFNNASSIIKKINLTRPLMLRIPIVAALAATGSTVKITQAMEPVPDAPTDSATCLDCLSKAATNVVSSIVDGAIIVEFDAPVTEEIATIASYNISVLG